MNLNVALVIVLFLGFAHALSSVFNDATPIVDTEYGKVRGQQRITLFDSKVYYSFRGIPFAQPPVGELRFQVKIKSAINFKLSIIVKS